MTRKKSLQWVDFKKIMISETGMVSALFIGNHV